MGVHNVDYARALLEASLDSLGVALPAPVATQARTRPAIGGSK